jgi:hypothetical protein
MTKGICLAIDIELDVQGFIEKLYYSDPFFAFFNRKEASYFMDSRTMPPGKRGWKDNRLNGVFIFGHRFGMLFLG